MGRTIDNTAYHLVRSELQDKNEEEFLLRHFGEEYKEYMESQEISAISN